MDVRIYRAGAPHPAANRRTQEIARLVSPRPTSPTPNQATKRTTGEPFVEDLCGIASLERVKLFRREARFTDLATRAEPPGDPPAVLVVVDHRGDRFPGAVREGQDDTDEQDESAGTETHPAEDLQHRVHRGVGRGGHPAILRVQPASRTQAVGGGHGSGAT